MNLAFTLNSSINSPMNSPIKNVWGRFSGISLQQLDSKAALPERIDNKYIVGQDVLAQALAQWSSYFNILEINGKSSFHYANCYFDDEKYSCFSQHRQGRRKRFKVRTRHYVDSNTCFVEIKLKGNRGRTIKKRMSYSPAQAEYLDAAALAFIRTAYSDAYGHPFVFELKPVLTIHYQRSTLVAIEGHERLTIDTQIKFSDDKKSFSLNADTTIIETKTITRQGVASKILAGLHQRPISGCSKYCLGQVLLGKVKRYNRFLKAVRKLTLLN